jgi:hypothetical protein
MAERRVNYGGWTEGYKNKQRVHAFWALSAYFKRKYMLLFISYV